MASTTWSSARRWSSSPASRGKRAGGTPTETCCPASTPTSSAATGVAVLGALYASRVTTATLHALAGLPAPPGAAHRLAAAVASGAGTRVAAAVPAAARAAVTHAARAGTASGLNDVLLAAAAFRRARRYSWIRLRTRPSQAPTTQPRPARPQRTGRPAGPSPAPGPAVGPAQNNATRTSSRHRRRPAGSPQVSIPGLPPGGPRSRFPAPTGCTAPKRPGVDSSPDRPSPEPIAQDAEDVHTGVRSPQMLDI
jgi:hypothetical protein